MLSTRSFLLATAVTLITSIPLSIASFSFNSAFASNGITIQGKNFNGTISPNALSKGCAAAYSAPVNCSNSLVFVGPTTIEYNYIIDTEMPESAFQTLYGDVCTANCYTSLQRWRENLVGSCQSDFEKLFGDVSISETYKGPDTETFLSSFALPAAQAGKDVSQFAGAYAYTETQWIDWIFWQKCLRDLNSTSYCATDESKTELTTWPTVEASRYLHLDKAEALARNQTFCQQGTCFMQSEVLSVVTTGMYDGGNATVADLVQRIGTVCPDINVNASFPFLQLGVMYPFNDSTKIAGDSASSTDSPVPTASSHSMGGIVDLSGVNSTDKTSGSSTMPVPISGILLHVGCLAVVAGAALFL